jgi:Co/Zn/Cd efflux system component
MDCPSEEQLIRMKLDGLQNIHSLQFDIPNRQLKVFHSGSPEEIFKRLDSLNFNTTILETTQADVSQKPTDKIVERKLLWWVLAINFFFFILEMVTGLLSNSMGLVADSLDMLADSFVYGLALFAVGGSLIRKKNIAQASGYLQLFLAIAGFLEVIRRFIGFEPIPGFLTMMIVSAMALTGNASSLYILQKSKSKDAHMQASVIFTSNDIIANIGVIIAGVLVYFTASRYPDLIVGTFVFALVLRGAFRILKLA